MLLVQETEYSAKSSLYSEDVYFPCVTQESRGLRVLGWFSTSAMMGNLAFLLH